MPELIDKIEALGKLQTMYIQIECACGDGNLVVKGVRKAYKAIERMPTIEPEVRHGRWVKLPESCQADYECSECGAGIGKIKPPYCAICGLRMDGGADNG